MTGDRLKAGVLDDPVWSDVTDEAGGHRVPRSGRRTHRGLATVILAALLAGLWVGFSALMSASVVRTYEVPSASMVPTIQPDTRVSAFLLDTAPHRGDIVILDAPPQAQSLGTTPSTLVKRVVAIGGDTVACCDGGRLVLNGRPASEPYAAGPQPPFGLVRVPVGKMFVLGDNRSDSQDSRLWGPISTDLVVGHVVAQGASAAILSPMVLGAFVALVVTLLAWLLGVRRTSAWRGASEDGDPAA